jgi:uncharacterized membrane protein YcgQ (UPF0703/DUF1980 family)
MIIALLTAVTIVLGMRMMGALLISSLIIFPALSSMRLFKSFRTVTISSALISVVCFLAGVFVSYVFATPTGASVVLFNMIVFAIFSVISAVRNNTRRGLVRTAAALVFGAMLIGCSKGPVLDTPLNAAGTRSVLLETAPEDVAAANSGETIEIREKMFIAQTNDIYLNPDDYLGKTIKLEGLFKTDNYDDMSRVFCFILRYGPGCCGNDSSAGFEVSWPEAAGVNSMTPLEDGHHYPKPDDWVAAEGTLSLYEDEGYPYLYLALSSLEVQSKRGAEYVNQ